jgi:hypothetical protein
MVCDWEKLYQNVVKFAHSKPVDPGVRSNHRDRRGGLSELVDMPDSWSDSGRHNPAVATHFASRTISRTASNLLFEPDRNVRDGRLDHFL